MTFIKRHDDIDKESNSRHICVIDLVSKEKLGGGCGLFGLYNKNHIAKQSPRNIKAKVFTLLSIVNIRVL